MDKKEKIEMIAMVANDVNRAFCEGIGDPVPAAWEEASEEIKESSRNGVAFVLDNPDVSPEQSHENWMKFKTEHGWKYGPVKDEKKKEHPDLVPYDELPKNQKAKDFIFRAVVKSMWKGL